jgi:small conductance mechanosensitive channel
MDAILANLQGVLQTWWESFLTNMPSIIAGVVIFIFSFYAARWLKRVVSRVMARRNADAELTLLIGRLTRWTVITLGLVLALQQAGVDVTAILTGLGVVGFTVGFALKDISANFVAGIILLFQQPFDLGDTINVQEYTGTVTDIDLRATEMMTFDGLRVMIPNNSILTSVITNYSRLEKRRLVVQVGVGYDNDLQKVEEIALEAIRSLEGVLDDPAPFVMFDSFGDFAVNMSVYYWYATGQIGYFEVTNQGMNVIKTTLEKAGVSTPFPIQTVRVEQAG